MTAKRFTRIICSNDEYTGSLYCNDEPLKIEEVCTLLNELHEENQQQKTFLKSLREELQLADRDNTYLEKENKELKSLCKVLITHIEKNSIAFVIDEDVRRLLE